MALHKDFVVLVSDSIMLIAISGLSSILFALTVDSDDLNTVRQVSNWAFVGYVFKIIRKKYTYYV